MNFVGGLWTMNTENWNNQTKWNKNCSVNKQKREEEDEEAKNGIHISNKIMHIHWRIPLITFYFFAIVCVQNENGEKRRPHSIHHRIHGSNDFYDKNRFGSPFLHMMWNSCTLYSLFDIISLNVEWTNH